MCRIKLHYIYLLIGTVTVVLNLALTVHLFRSRKGPDYKGTPEADEFITFSLVRRQNAEGVTTAAVPYDETVPLKEET